MTEIYTRLLDLLGNDPRGIREELPALFAGLEPVDFVREDPDLALTYSGSDGFKFKEDSIQPLQNFLTSWVERYRRLEDERRDELTGLYTRSYWERELKRKAFPDLRSLALIDIDHFKHFNDTYGHQMGDRVLEAVGAEIFQALATGDMAVRYGGEEFLLTSRDSVKQFRNRLESLRKKLAESLLFDNQPEAVTVSVGITSFSGSQVQVEQLVEKADCALYEAKASGRNCIRVYAPYMSRSISYYVWGIYRYLWGTGSRVAFNGRRMLLFDEKASFYNWHENRSRAVSFPEQMQFPVRKLEAAGKVFYLLDADGCLWYGRGPNDWQKAAGNRIPELVDLLGNGEHLFAVGVNNQLYSFDSGRLVHYNSLPENWEQVAFAGRPYCLLNDKIFPAGQSENILTELPEDSLQVSADGKLLYILGKSGNIYRFSPADGRRAMLELVNTERRVVVRELVPRRNRLLMLDSAGRLLYARRRPKAIPQVMAIE